MTNTGWGKRRLHHRSKYQPHEGISEQMRRVGQMLRRGEYVQPDVKAMYIDYSIAKAAGQDLSRFKLQEPAVTEPVVVKAERVGEQIGYIDAQPAEDRPDKA